MSSTIINKVAQSGILTLNLETFLPKEDIVAFDIKPYLFKELLLKEKDFRAAMKLHDWAQYEGKAVAVFCSSDAIVPAWAYMLIGSSLSKFTSNYLFGSIAELKSVLFLNNIKELDLKKYENQRVVIKGCGDVEIPTLAYVEATRLLRPIAKSIMYGEPCSTVPVYKQPLKRN